MLEYRRQIHRLHVVITQMLLETLTTLTENKEKIISTITKIQQLHSPKMLIKAAELRFNNFHNGSSPNSKVPDGAFSTYLLGALHFLAQCKHREGYLHGSSLLTFS